MLRSEKAAQILRGNIAKGILKPGQKLDAEAELCRNLGVGIEALRIALQKLRDEQLIYTVRGHGSYVGDGRVTGTPEKVAQGFRDDITSGALTPGQQLESVLELSRTLKTHKKIVRQALGILRAENLIYTVHAIGSFVTDGTPEYTAPNDVRALRAEHDKRRRCAEAEIEKAILAGEYQPGEKLPGAAEIATRYDISTHAVRQVYIRLRDKGLVHTIRPAGTFAGPDTHPCSQRQIARRGLLDDIRNGNFPLGHLIPLESYLAKRYGVNIAVVNDVVGELLCDSILEMSHNNRNKVGRMP